MKNQNIKVIKTFALMVCFGWTLNTQGQSLGSLIIPGATNTGPLTWNVEYVASSVSGAAANLSSKEIKLVQTNTKGTYAVFDNTNGSTGWEVGYNNTGFSALCKTELENSNACNNGTCTTSYTIRNNGTTEGEFNGSIKIAISNSANGNNRCFYNASTAITLNVKVRKVAASGIYNWTGPVSGNDSSYKIASNWTPTRTTPSVNDILIVDLAQTPTLRNTTIFMDGVNEAINQFRISPYNNVTFKCSTSTNTGVLSVGKATSAIGTDFELDTLAGIRIAGGTLTLNIVSGNTAILKSNLSVLSGTLNINGPGTVTHRANILVNGGTLRYNSSLLTTLNLAGTNTKLSGTGGTLYIDSNVNVVIGNGTTSNYTLERILPIISNLTLRPNTTLISNSPLSNSVSDINNWTPFLQLNSTPKSNSTARGQLLTVPSGAAITGGAQFEIFNNKQRAYRAFGLPLLNGTTIPQFTDDIEVTGTVTGSNANEFSTTCNTCTHSMFEWNEGTRSWSPYASGNSVTNIPLGTGILTFFRGARGNGLGDTTVVANERTIDFKGALATGTISVTINNTGSSALKGYNLVGNPYPCAIDLRQVFETNKTKISPRFYFYDAIARRYNEWDSTTTNANAVTPTKNGSNTFTQSNAIRNSRILDAGAAVFLIVNSNNSSENITFQESHKSQFFKSTTKHFSSGVQQEVVHPCNEIKGELRYQDATWTESDGFTIVFDMDGINSDGDFYDMNKLYAGYMGFGTLTANNTWLSIDRRSKIAEIGETKSVPLKVAYPKEGPTAMELGFNFCSEGNTNYKIQLFDKTNNSATEITNGVVYPFTASNADEKKADRFELLFTGIEKQSSNKSINSTAFSVFPNPSENGIIYVTNTQGHTITAIELINQMGQIVKKFPQHNPKTLIELNHDNLPTGLYFLRIVSPNFTQTQSVSLK